MSRHQFRNQQETQYELSEDISISINWDQNCNCHLPLLHPPYTAIYAEDKAVWWTMWDAKI